MKHRVLAAPRRRRLTVAALLLTAAAATSVVVPAAAKNGVGPKLDAKVVSTNLGPLTSCSTNCSGGADTTRNFIYVENGNSLLNAGGDRSAVPNSFVVSSIDQAIFVDGVRRFDFTYTPPPDPSYRPFASHWPSAVGCPSEGPCNIVVGSPAVLPGEQTAVLYAGWSHGATEPNGTYVFKYTIHGTLNGVTLARRELAANRDELDEVVSVEPGVQRRG